FASNAVGSDHFDGMSIACVQQSKRHDDARPCWRFGLVMSLDTRSALRYPGKFLYPRRREIQAVFAGSLTRDRPAPVANVWSHEPGQGVTEVFAGPTPPPESQADSQLGDAGGVIRLVPGERQDQLGASGLEGRRRGADSAVVDHRPAQREQLA